MEKTLYLRNLQLNHFSILQGKNDLTSGYYADVNTRDFAIGGAMAVVRLLNTTGTNAYIYSDIKQISPVVTCIDYVAGGHMATTKVSSGNIYAYSDLVGFPLGSTSNGIIMAPGGNMTITKSSSGVVNVWNQKGLNDSFTGEVLDFIAGGNMSVVRKDASLNYKAYIYNSSGLLDYTTNVKDYSVAGLYANSGGTVGVINNITAIPIKFSISQNFPNPFNPTTKIRFDITKSGKVKLIVYDILGKVIATLMDEVLTAGSYETDFDAGSLSSGVYFYKIETNDFSDVKRMMLLK